MLWLFVCLTFKAHYSLASCDEVRRNVWVFVVGVFIFCRICLRLTFKLDSFASLLLLLLLLFHQRVLRRVHVCVCLLESEDGICINWPTDRPNNCPTLFLTVLSNVYMYVWVFMCVCVGVCNCHFTCWLRYSFHTERQSINVSLFSVIHSADQRGWGEGDWLSLPNNLCIYFANSTEKRRNSINEQTNTRERTPSTNFVATTSDSNNLLNGLDRNLCVRFDPKKVASKLLSFAIENNWSINVSVVVIVVCCSVYGSLRFPRPVLYVVVFCVIYKFTVTCLACWLLLLLLLLLLL